MTEGRVFAIVLALLAFVIASMTLGEALHNMELYGSIGAIVAALILIAVAIFGPEWKE